MTGHRRVALGTGGLVVSLVAVWAGGCGDGTTEPPDPDPSVPTTVTVTPATAELASLGATAQLSAQVLDQYGNAMTTTAVSWASSAAGVAVVDATGLVTAAGNGTATVTATAGSASGSAAVTVEQVPAAVALSPDSLTFASLADTATLAAGVTDANGHPIDGISADWSSSDPGVAVVDATGLVTAAGNGTATVTATAGSASGSATVTVAQVPAAVALSPDSLTFASLADTATLAAGVTDANGHPIDGISADWSSSDPGVAAVDGAGLVTAASNGHATVTASSGSASGSATVAVAQVATDVTVSPPTSSVLEADTVRFTAEAADGNGHRVVGAVFAWSSSDTLVAVVDESGLVAGRGAGEAEITAATSEVTGSAALVVVEPVPTSVVVTPDRVRLTAVGQTSGLAAEVRDQIGRVMDGVPVSWSSGDPAVAVVDAAGLVTATGNGTATITAAAGSASGSAAVTVEQSAGSVTVSPARATIPLGDTLRLVARAVDVNGNVIDEAEFEWSSDDPSVVAVDPMGLVTGAGEGGATITAAAGDAAGSAEIVVDNPDRAPLVALYEATDGPSWLNSENWLTDAPLREWYGVSTDPWGRVAVLDLAGRWDSENRVTVTHGLSGLIPPELGDLANLERLYLNDNELSGPIPPELGTLANLERLYLNSNDLSGPIPPEIGALANLERLYLDSNGLSGPIPPEIGAFAKLERLYLNSNDLSGPIPPELGTLAGLKRLYLDSNDLSGPIPPKLGSLDGLERLYLHSNQLSGPIPPEIGDLANLRRLYLRSNQLSGPVQRTLGGLDNLERLYLNDNELSGPIPTELGDLANLEALYLHSNQLSGPIPPAIGNLASLESLYLTFNQLSGPIPPGIGNLANLESLDLSSNLLSGPIPPGIGDLANLQRLYLHDNQLSGPIPPELGDLVNLQRLYLWRNDFSGPIPTQLGNLVNLEALWLWYNGFSGPIPPEFGGLANLESLDVSSNHLSGPIPPELGDLVNLSRLDLNNNELSGPVPPEFGSLSSLVSLHVANNRAMRGALPPEMTSLSRLDALVAGGTGLCSPADPRFQSWLERVGERWIANCAPSEAYLTQAVQSLEFPVPLVGGEKALLRVFPTASRRTDEGIPLVRARFHHNGEEVYEVDIPGKSTRVPTEVDEGDLDRSANIEIPGWVVKPGLEMVIEIDPGSTLDPGLGVTKRIPEEGRIAVEVGDMPVFDLTLIPFVWTQTHDSAIVDVIDAMEDDPEGHEFFGHMRLLPVGAMEVTAHEPVLSSSNNAFTLLLQTRAIRALEGGGGHYKGIMSPPVTGAGGVAYAPGRSSFSQPYDHIIAHELGHNMNLFHAPCGDPAGVDPAYPHPDGNTGSWGYDFEAGELVGPSTPDLMSYCGPQWISDYHFTKALRFRLSDADNEQLPSLRSPVRSLLLWGGIDADGMPFLEPAFVVDAPPLSPESAGDWRLAGTTDTGAELFSLSFAMPVVANGDGRSGFVFVLPAEASWEGSLAAVTLDGPAGSATLDGDGDDPMAILRDLRSGRVRAILRDLPAGVRTRADAEAALSPPRGLDVLFSRGLPEGEGWRR